MPIVFVQDRVSRKHKNFAVIRRLSVFENDSRITRLGRLLCNWTPDEIPQLLNVLKGDKSIVSPRPWVPAQAAFRSSTRWHLRPDAKRASPC